MCETGPSGRKRHRRSAAGSKRAFRGTHAISPPCCRISTTSIKPYATGNLHPSFMGWVHGAGTPVGMVAEMLAAGLNANCGGRNHIGIDVERQITQWMREAFSFPDSASGVFVTGTSMANFLGLLIARNRALGGGVRRNGLQTGPRFWRLHVCGLARLHIAGDGACRDRVRLPSTNSLQCGRRDGGGCASRCRRGRQSGRHRSVSLWWGRPVRSIIGAIDPLSDLADLCRRERIWFHVDGAFGALAALSEHLRPLLDGMERADSIAFDFHKWAHVPYDAGFLLVRDGDEHRRAFASQNQYLTRAETGLAAGDIWPCDLGPDLSRSFRALKTWFTFKVFGADRLGAMMEKSCGLARRLAGAVVASPLFELAAPVPLNIVCLIARCNDADRVNRQIVESLHTSGQAAPSITILNGVAVIRLRHKQPSYEYG